MAKVPSPANLNIGDSRALKIWLYQLWQAVGGETTLSADLTALENQVNQLDLDIDSVEDDIASLESNQILTKQTIVNIGSTYVQDAVINVIDADITANSLVTAQITPVGASYTRPPEEVIYERIIVFCTPKSGSVDFYLNPERGYINGQFLITYMVKI